MTTAHKPEVTATSDTASAASVTAPRRVGKVRKAYRLVAAAITLLAIVVTAILVIGAKSSDSASVAPVPSAASQPANVAPAPAPQPVSADNPPTDTDQQYAIWQSLPDTSRYAAAYAGGAPTSKPDVLAINSWFKYWWTKACTTPHDARYLWGFVNTAYANNWYADHKSVNQHTCGRVMGFSNVSAYPGAVTYTADFVYQDGTTKAIVLGWVWLDNRWQLGDSA